MTFPRYPKYKHSGVEWLGEVPEGWEVWKLSHAFSVIGSGTTPSTENVKYYDGDIPWLNTGDLNDAELSNCSKRITHLALADISSLKIYPIGSLVIAMYGATIGKLGLLRFSATVNQACCVFSGTSSIESRYMFYWFLGLREHILSLATGGGQPNISQDILKKLRIAAPDKSEQTAIATFLDHETSKIDALINEQQKLIALLKEKRQAVISHAVTKGLDPNVPMKHSGVEWLGEVPEGWEAGALRWLTQRYSGGTPDKTNLAYWENGTIPWLNSGAVNERFIKEPSTYITSEAFDKSSTKWIPEGALVMALAGQGKTKGMVAQLGIPATCNQSMAAIIPGSEITARFLFWWLESNYQNIRNMAGGDLRDGLNLELLGSIYCSIPPLAEQTAIASFLDHETSKIDALIAEAERAIDLLQERRTALISAAVTGQIDVRGFSVQ